MKEIEIVKITDIEAMTGLSRTVITSIIADNNIPCIHAGNSYYISLDNFVKCFNSTGGTQMLKTKVHDRRVKARARNKQYIGTDKYKGKVRDEDKSKDQIEKATKDRLQHNRSKQKLYGVMIECSEYAKQLPTHLYLRERDKAYKRQQYRAFTGSKSNNEEYDFLYDFDLERMYKDGFTFKGKKMQKWWTGEIKHWTVKDGVWRD